MPIKEETDKVLGFEWRPCTLTIPNVSDAEKEDVLDVAKMCLRPRSGLFQPKHKGLPNKIKVVKDALQEDPYNMMLINELGRLYVCEGRWENGVNVLLRGWKRAGEIPDPKIRFHFLMKLSEGSYRLSKFLQAFAVLQDIEEPASGEDLTTFLVFACQLCSAVGDSQRALRYFARAIEGATFHRAVRALTMAMYDLHKANAFESAQAAVQKLSKTQFDGQTLSMLHTMISKPKPRMEQKDFNKLMITIAVVTAVILLIYVLYLLEQHSLSKIKVLKDLKK